MSDTRRYSQCLGYWFHNLIYRWHTDVLLKDFSKLESKSTSLENIPFDLTELIDSTLDQISEVAAKKNIGKHRFYDIISHRSFLFLELLFAAELTLYPLWISGDSIRVKQCLNNFLSNAVKFAVL